MAEIKAIEQKPMHMKDWVAQLDKFISAFDKKVLTDAGSISRAQAEIKAKSEYRKYQQQIISEVEKAYLESLKEVGEKVKKIV